MVQIHSPRPFFSSLDPSVFLLSLVLGVFILCAPFGLSGYSDFRQLYTAAWMIRTGHASELYAYDAQAQFQRALIERPIAALPFNHLSYEGLLLTPFSLVSYRVAYLLVAACNFALAAYSFAFARRDGVTYSGLLGYRALSADYEQGSGRTKYVYDVVMHGPVTGLTIGF